MSKMRQTRRAHMEPDAARKLGNKTSGMITSLLQAARNEQGREARQILAGYLLECMLSLQDEEAMIEELLAEERLRPQLL